MLKGARYSNEKPKKVEDEGSEGLRKGPEYILAHGRKQLSDGIIAAR